MLEDFKTDLGIFDSSKDKQLKRLLDKSTIDIMNITHQSKDYAIQHLSEQIIDLATIRYNRKGSEGLTSQSYSGVSEHYINDISNDMMRSLMPHRRLPK